MSDVVVHVAVGDDQTESKFFDAINDFARSRSESDELAEADAPEIMVKTVHDGEKKRKAITFQDRKTAFDFLLFWRGR
ncbi:hypothetical protein [Ponticaulis sp.]|uniref:hypothetical protein n=1 Tax=Ponticaulis sp. TaxID=2020902 RepID=UPI000B62C3B7|nr:hypothetical protein [Ponticaulis sp.]MAI89611.1 hypothetical protein [Ponticaulis sp.]OUY00636.1 MAG: hypothetical protein CBB65_04165 [Hyphomonadaceae bacterium TMED5]|tara:strand:+ start:182004 stop:182237 length:234 start_codon:yes stop_codon:yes gene_type:complete